MTPPNVTITFNALDKRALNKVLTRYSSYAVHEFPALVTREQALMMKWIEKDTVCSDFYQLIRGDRLNEWGSLTAVYAAHVQDPKGETVTEYGHLITLCKEFGEAVDGIVKSGDHVFREVRRHGDERVYCDATVFVDI